ncbi:MAG TPA: pyridoxamine 5'-phosphate oxidase family protein [Candidatus Saccharimonadales bacterium]|nr:pyridoxamine 5'-phosphate oxidase family protein [Candidatus Saccharimonadales bacterium]
MEPKESILKHLKVKKVMQLATVRDGQPWVCNLHFWADDDGNLYWISTEARRHSQEIKDDPRVAAAIAVQTDEEVPGTPPIGIQVEGDAEIVTGSDMQTKLRSYFDYQNKPEKLYEDILSGENPHKLYRLKPRLYVIFDVQNSPKDPRQEWRVS